MLNYKEKGHKYEIKKSKGKVIILGKISKVHNSVINLQII